MSSEQLLDKQIDGGMDDNGITTHKWKVSLFGCLDTLIPNTLMATFCPCISIAQLLARVGFASYMTGLIVTFITYILFFVAMGVTSKAMDAIAVILGVGYFGYMWYVRARIRGLFHIPGNLLEDCVSVLFCGCCALAQMATHVESYNPNDCAIDAKATLPGYIV